MSNGASLPNGRAGGKDTASYAKATGVQTLLEAILFGLGLYYLGFADGGLVGWLKLGVLCLAGWLVAFLINRLAIEKGVSLAATGSKIAGPLSGISVFLVGFAFFLATLMGLLAPKVEELRLVRYVEAFQVYALDRIAIADSATELAPVLQAVAGNLSARAEQEGETGWGPIANTWRAQAGRARGLFDQMATSLSDRDAVLDQIMRLLGAMEATLADETMRIWDRRALLRKQHGQVLGLLTQLDGAVPVSLISSFVRELEQGVLVPNRSEASAVINHTLTGYAETLRAALAAESGSVGAPPAFPSESGALDTLQYAGTFAPIAVLIFVIDVLFPMLLWAYTLMTFLQAFPRAPKPVQPASIYDWMTGRNAIDPSELGQPEDGEKRVEDKDDSKLPRKKKRRDRKSRR